MTYEDRDHNAAYALNSYVEKLLRANLDWTPDKYAGTKPILPSAQQPELLQTGKPFIVYGFARGRPGHLYALKHANLTYRIYSQSSTEANTITSLLEDVFERQDEAADDVNAWIDLEGEHRAGGPRNVSFGSTGLTMVEKAEPADEEGGYTSSLVLFDLVYTSESDTVITTRFLDF